MGWCVGRVCAGCEGCEVGEWCEGREVGGGWTGRGGSGSGGWMGGDRALSGLGAVVTMQPYNTQNRRLLCAGRQRLTGLCQ